MDYNIEGHQGGTICVDPETRTKDNWLISLEVCFIFIVENFVPGPFLSVALPFQHCASYTGKQEEIFNVKRHEGLERCEPSGALVLAEDRVLAENARLVVETNQMPKFKLRAKIHRLHHYHE